MCSASMTVCAYRVSCEATARWLRVWRRLGAGVHRRAQVGVVGAGPWAEGLAPASARQALAVLGRCAAARARRICICRVKSISADARSRAFRNEMEMQNIGISTMRYFSYIFILCPLYFSLFHILHAIWYSIGRAVWKDVEEVRSLLGIGLST